MQYLALNKYSQTYIFASPLAKQNESMKHKFTVVGEMIAFIICNKPFKLLGIPRGQVKSRESLTEMILINIVSAMSLKRINFHTNHGSHS
jgi:hypothetical protein